MGALARAEVCELFSNFSINYLKNMKKKNLAVYRDDRLAIFKNVNGPDSEKF